MKSTGTTEAAGNGPDMEAEKPKSLYRELTIALVALVTLVSIAVNLLNYAYFSREAETLYESKSSEYAVYLREALEWPLWNVDDELIGKIGSAFASNAEIALLTIRDDQRRVVYHHEKPNGELLRREIAIEHNGQNIGSVEIGLTLSIYEERDRQLLLASIGTMALLIAVLLGTTRWLLSRLLRKPVEALAGATRDMVEGKYREIELPETYVEFAAILSGFKTMSDAVASRESSLKQINEQLFAEVGERKRAEEALRGSEEQLRFVADHVPVLIAQCDRELRYKFVNRPYAALFGLQPADIIGKHAREVLGEEAYGHASIHMQAALSGQAADFDNTLPPAEGQSHTVHASYVPERDADGNVVGFIAAISDITERKHAEDELRRYKDHLEEEVQQRTADLVLARNAAEAANKAKSVFLASMSHELRTPLNAILGFSNMMRKDVQLSEPQRENLDIINRSGEHLLTLINDVLEMAKIEAGRVQLENIPFDLGGMVRDVTDMMHVRAQEKGLRLLVDQSSAFPRYIRGDEARLRQVLINLVGNAVKFTEQGGVTVRLGVRQHITQQHLLVEVEDSGVGIKPEDQQKIFEPFVQLGKTATQKGTGLGLTITRQFVELMGGTIGVESVPGKGSIFRVELPVDRVAEADVDRPEGAQVGEITGLASGQPAYRILIAEDQLENQLLLARLMQGIGFETRVVENGEQAVDIFQSWHPHLIWMDRRMPVMDGIEATRRIRQLPGGGEVKIVAVTASAFVEQRDELLKAGMDDFVRKPYRFNEIYECLTRQLGVQYVYAGAREAEEVSEVALTAEMLGVLPPDLRRELRGALESLEGERIAAAIQQAAAHDPMLHKTLSRLAENFDYPAILKALE
jgi:PAS domain S-box-containing protein